MARQGVLKKNTCGRYEIDCWTELTCGTVVELFINGAWVKTRIEHDGNDYYAVGQKGLTLEGVTARVE